MPHAGSATIETRKEMARMVVEDVRRVLSGEKPLRRWCCRGRRAREGARRMTRKVVSDFTRLDAAADGLLRRMAKGETALAWLQARWAASWASRWPAQIPNRRPWSAAA